MERPHERLTGGLTVRTQRRSLVLAGAAGLVPLAVVVVFFVVPVAGMVGRGFFPGGRLDLAGVADALLRPRVAHVVAFTLWSSGLATLLTVVLGLPTAYVLHRLRFPGQAVLRGLVTVPFVLPTVVVGVAFRTLLAPGEPLGGLGWDGTAQAIVAALVFFNLSVMVRTVGARWEGLDRRREEAAAALGASPLQVLRTVTLPALLPAVVSAASVVFLFCATAFGVVLTLGGLRYATVETEIYLLTTQFLDLQGAAALSVLQIVAVVALLALTRRLGGRGSASVQRTVRLRRRRPGLRDVPAVLVTALVVLALAAPMATLLVRSLRVDGAWSLGHYRSLGTTGDVLAVPVSTALQNSLRVAVDATLLALLLGLTVAVLVTRPVRAPGARRAAAVFDGIFMLPLGVSAVTVGFGLLVALDRPPLDFRGSPWLVPVAQAMVALPLVVRLVAPALRSVDPRQREAAATLGASPLRVLLVADLPAAGRAVLAAAGFAFAVSLGEFGATSFLARPQTTTLPVAVYELVSRPGADNYGAALAASVVLGGLTALVMVVVDRVRVGSLGGW